MGAEQSGISSSTTNQSGTINLRINGQPHTVGRYTKNVNAEYKLVDFIRDNVGLKGTKTMCREGGCGACIVSVTSQSQTRERSVNSCLVPILSCDGWSITTVEGLGNLKDGYHSIQQNLADFSGTQCGFCSPGMVMNMYSLVKSKKSLNAAEIEKNFDGNICRCTGYRPILDAFKAISLEVSDKLNRKSWDIEDCGTCPLKNPPRNEGLLEFTKPSAPSNVVMHLKSGEKWVKATTLKAAFAALDAFKKVELQVRIVAGNTGTGVFKMDNNDVKAFVDITNIPELSVVNNTMETGDLILGGSVTLATAILAFQQASIKEGFGYTNGLVKHIQRVANAHVRNVGTLAGNLMLKNRHREYASDLFTLFETVGAEISVASSPTSIKIYNLTEFVSLNMDNHIIVSLSFKSYTKQHIFRSFKIAQRYQNSIGYVNAGFLMKIDSSDNFKVLERPRIVYGGINKDFIHADKTESYLVGKSLKDPNVIKAACAKLNKPLQRASQRGETTRKRSKNEKIKRKIKLSKTKNRTKKF